MDVSRSIVSDRCVYDYVCLCMCVCVLLIEDPPIMHENELCNVNIRCDMCLEQVVIMIKWCPLTAS